MWIAFIFQYLWDTKQHIYKRIVQKFSCELLSFFSIFGIQNNLKNQLQKPLLVVNCFHFSVSLGYKTTLQKLTKKTELLWIAFIFQYLWDTKQQEPKMMRLPLSCELLSFFSIFGIQNNYICFLANGDLVVNCFHFSVSLGYKTTLLKFGIIKKELWIAFIFQYLWDTKQLG